MGPIGARGPPPGGARSVEHVNPPFEITDVDPFEPPAEVAWTALPTLVVVFLFLGALKALTGAF